MNLRRLNQDKGPKMRLLPTLALIATALPALSQEVSDEATGNFAGPARDGYFYSAEVYRNAEYLALRIWTGTGGDPSGYTLVLDNPRFAYTPIGGREWLEAMPEGPLVLMTSSVNDGYLYTTRTILTQIDTMIAVTRQDAYNNRLTAGAPLPGDTMRCFGEDCYSCEADVLNGAGLAGGVAIAAPVAYADLNAALWGPERTTDLGLCPAPD